MKTLIFSADAHVKEPTDLFTKAMPKHLEQWTINARRSEKYNDVMVGEKIAIRIAINFGNSDDPRRGSMDIALRLEDMQRDGIDAEVIFPTLGLVNYLIEYPEAENLSAQIYNNWVMNHFKDHLDTFVPAAILPVRDIANTLAELKRCDALGFTAAMLPVVPAPGIPTYNQPEWDAVFNYAGAAKIPLIMHTGTGNVNIRAARGPGGAVINYGRQMNDAVDAICYLVGGGVLDRNPEAKVVFVECGASWLVGLGERLDEVYFGHEFHVSPKLNRLPSQIIRDQVVCTFQNDRNCVANRAAMGLATMVWASDYPHMEGTFPNSKSVLKKLFEGVNISEEEKAAIVGGTAAKLFRLRRQGIAA